MLWHSSLGPVPVAGNLVDNQTRCSHYHSPLDVVAIKFPCCDIFYPCFQCHDTSADHPPKKWLRKSLENTPVVLCGVCRKVLTHAQYTQNNDRCAGCGTGFNPGCKNHSHLYFAT